MMIRRRHAPRAPCRWLAIALPIVCAPLIGQQARTDDAPPAWRAVSTRPRSVHVTLDDALQPITFTIHADRGPARRVRVRAPHIGRADGGRYAFQPLAEFKALTVKLDRLECVVRPGEPQTITATLRPVRPIPAGRYKVQFAIEDAPTGDVLAMSTVFLKVPPRIGVGRPVVEQIDTLSDPRRVSAIVRFHVAGNIDAAHISLRASQLVADDGRIVLPLDERQPVQFNARHARIDGRATWRGLARPTAEPGTWQTEQAVLARPDTRGIDEDVYARVWWVRPAGARFSAGHYRGEIALIVLPE